MLTSEERDLVLKKYCESEKYEIVSFEESDLFNYESVSNILYFLIKIKVLINGTIKEVSFIGKTIKNKKNKDLQKEIDYFNFIKQFSSDGIYNPILYYVRSDNLLLVFEDYFKKGFDFYKNIVPLDSAHIKLALKTLAKFHASNIVLEENKSKDLKRTYRITEDLKTLKTGETDLYNSWFQEKINRLKNVVKFLHENNLTNQKLNENLNCLVTNSMSLIKSYKFRSVLCHGYMCGKNVLFKYNDNKEPTQCKLINFELQKYTSPVFDVLHFIFMVTTSKIRKLLFDDYLQWYYLCLKKELKIHNINIHKIIPHKEEYEVAVYCFLPFIKLYSTCLKISKNLISTSNDSIVEKDDFNVEEYLKNNEYYKKVVIESIVELEDLIENKGLLLEDLYRIIKSKLKSTNYTLINYQVIPLEHFAGFMGNHNRLKVTVMFNNEEKVLHLFAKFTPLTQVQINVTRDTGAFSKEIFIYNDLVEMMNNNGISGINDCVVPCYFTRHNNLLIFDDYAFYGYKTLEARTPFDLDTIKIVIDKMAKFHSFSIIVEEKLSKERKTKFCLNKHYSKELQEGMMFKSETNQAALVFSTGVDTVAHQLDLFFGLDFTKSNPELMKKVDKTFEATFELVKPSKEFRNVICHGDLWSTNVLMRYDENGVVSDCRMIDFQLCRYCPPSHDLLNLIFMTTDRKFRKDHFNYLIELYYRELSKYLADYKYDIQEIIPYSSYLDSIENMMPQAISQCVCSFQMILLNSEITKEYMTNEASAENVLVGNRKDFVTQLFLRDPLFRARARDSLEDLIEVALKYF